MATKINPKSVQQSMDLFDDAVKTRSTSFFGKGGILSTSYTKTLDSVLQIHSRHLKHQLHLIEHLLQLQIISKR